MSKKTRLAGKTENTAHELKPYLYKSGAEWTGNAKGRPKGSRNKFAEAFIADFLADWEKHGAKALRNARRDDPSGYLRVAASILPKELNITDDQNQLDRILESLSDQELHSVITSLAAAGGAAKARKGNSIKEKAGVKSNSLH